MGWSLLFIKKLVFSYISEISATVTIDDTPLEWSVPKKVESLKHLED